MPDDKTSIKELQDKLETLENKTSSEIAGLKDRLEKLEKKNSELLKNIAPWRCKFIAGTLFLIFFASMFVCMTKSISGNDQITWPQVVAILGLTTAMVAIVWGFIYYTINLRGK